MKKAFDAALQKRKDSAAIALVDAVDLRRYPSLLFTVLSGGRERAELARVLIGKQEIDVNGPHGVGNKYWNTGY